MTDLYGTGVFENVSELQLNKGNESFVGFCAYAGAENETALC